MTAVTVRIPDVKYIPVMSLGPGLHHRRSIRIPEYDYAAPGRYYVTICTKHRECLFGNIVAGEMRLNEWGRIVQHTWADLPVHYPTIVLDAFVIMPNHVHGIIGIIDWGRIGGMDPMVNVGAQLNCAPTTFEPGHPLGQIVRSIKSFSTRKINSLRGTPGVPVWQRNYYERIVRNEPELDRIRRYIADNPRRNF